MSSDGAAAAAKAAVHTVRVGAAPESSHATNSITTSTYTPLNFVFKNLFKQYHRVSNQWFTVIAAMQMMKDISVTKGTPTILAPLSFVMVVAALKDGYEDYKRHQADAIENQRAAHRCTNAAGESGDCAWKDVATGELLLVRNREFIPSDLVLLASSNENGMCHVMTANLDGETNLKLRQVTADLLKAENSLVPGTDGAASAPEPTLAMGAPAAGATIECDAPNKHLSRFDGTVTLASGHKVPLSPQNVLLRGTVLRNTAWVVGAVVYTGEDTKIQRNAATAPPKMSRLGRAVDKQLYYVFISMIVLCGVAAAVGRGWIAAVEDHHYLRELGGTVSRSNFDYDSLLRFFTYVLVFTNYVPISLLVTQDLVKFAQSIWLNWDVNMYHAASDTPARVRSSDLLEELGQVDQIFSDKTGTLTCNVMAFRQASIGSVSYGDGGPPAVPEGRVTLEQTYCQFDDAAIVAARAGGGAAGAQITDFWLNLMLNHTIQAERPSDGSDGVVYSAASPDEMAFVYAAAQHGFVFKANAPNALVCSVDGEPRTYDLLHTLEFDSDRKRSSVIVRQRAEGGAPGTGPLLLFCKGADNVITPLLSEAHRAADAPEAALLGATERDITKYSAVGLRTLMICSKVLDPAFYEGWKARFHEAETALQNRAAVMAAAMAEIESDLALVGATAIEDKLQDGVVETISALREGGIQVWVLTGDKVDTAISISYAAALLTEEMEVMRLVAQDGTMAVDAHGVPLQPDLEALFEKLTAEARRVAATGKELALVADSFALEGVENFGMGERLIALGESCKSVVCARVTPDQKGMIVRLSQNTTRNPVTLAIGDGANDVNMIQKAHIGVGISGQEGLQAVNNSDFAIAQFRFLRNLLLVHGRWSSRRSVELTYYMFFKNCLLVIPQWVFGFSCRFSGQPVYTDMLYQMYNVMFTAYPVMAFGILDQDVKYKTAYDTPQVSGSSRCWCPRTAICACSPGTFA